MIDGDALSAFMDGDENRLDDIIGERERFKQLQQHPAWDELKQVADEAYHAASESVFQDPSKLQWAKGFREGVEFMFAMVGVEVAKYREAQDIQREMEAEKEIDLGLGESPL